MNCRKAFEHEHFSIRKTVKKSFVKNNETFYEQIGNFGGL